MIAGQRLALYGSCGVPSVIPMALQPHAWPAWRFPLGFQINFLMSVRFLPQRPYGNRLHRRRLVRMGGAFGVLGESSG